MLAAACSGEAGAGTSDPDAGFGTDGGLDSDAGDTADAGVDADAHTALDAAMDAAAGRRDASTPDAGLADAGPGDAGGDADAAAPWDAGPMPWERVPPERVLEECKLDPEALAEADRVLDTPWAVVRYGKLCHEFGAEGMARTQAWSATKTLGALVTGMVAYQSRDLPVTGPKTGPFSDEDRVDYWLDSFDYNPDAHIAHVLAMLAHNESLAYGEREMTYDTTGSVQINTLSEVLNQVIAQSPQQLGADLHQFTQTFLFDKLGLANSNWTGESATKVFGFSWEADVYDMAKVGQLMLRGGLWNGERLVAEDWIYRMTHPSFEDANTGYGYLTWLNASANYALGNTEFEPGALPLGPIMPGPCAPTAVYDAHPHGLSAAPDCNYGALYSCAQDYDVGVWQAVGLFGQVIQGHPGLDMVLVGRDLTAGTVDANGPGKLWDAVRPAVVEADPMFAGDEGAFCVAYGANEYAPDWAP